MQIDEQPSNQYSIEKMFNYLKSSETGIQIILNICYIFNSINLFIKRIGAISNLRENKNSQEESK